MKDSVDQDDIQQKLNYLQNCLHLQSTIMGCLGKALDDVLDTSMALASNVLLNKTIISLNFVTGMSQTRIFEIKECIYHKEGIVQF